MKKIDKFLLLIIGIPLVIWLSLSIILYYNPQWISDVDDNDVLTISRTDLFSEAFCQAFIDLIILGGCVAGGFGIYFVWQMIRAEFLESFPFLREESDFSSIQQTQLTEEDPLPQESKEEKREISFPLIGSDQREINLDLDVMEGT